MPTISIIVPVYNVEKYLDKCIKSILAQTFKDFELILVDDGSTDKSGKLCDEFLKVDSRIRVIHKENGGLSSARNAGIEAANGKFLGFVDSDDYIDDDMYEVLYNNLIKENADMSICGSYECFDGKFPKINKKNYKVFNAEEAVCFLYREKLFSVTAWDKLYKRCLFEEIRYPIGKIHEDVFVILDLLIKSNKIVFTSEQKYYYIQRENSITKSRSASKCCDVIEAWQRNYELINLHYPYLCSWAMDMVYYAHLFALDQLLKSSDENLYIEKENEIIKFLRNNAVEIIFKSHLSLKRKISMLILMLNKSAYRIFIKINSNIHHLNS